MEMIAALVAVLVTLGALGCEKQWQVGRTVVSAAAHGLVAADQAVVAAYEASPCESTQDPDELETCLSSLRSAVRGLQTTRAVIEQGESIVDLWAHGGTEPGAWEGWLESGAQALARLISVLDAATVPIPDPLREAAAALDAYIEARRSQ
jgi:hypothetical protein